MRITIVNKNISRYVSEDEVNQWRKEYNALHDYLEANNLVSYKADELPEGILPYNNEHTSSIEVWDWVHNPPEKYTLFIDDKNMLAITWIGDVLGHITYSREWKRKGKSFLTVWIADAHNTGRRYRGFYAFKDMDGCNIKRIK